MIRNRISKDRLIAGALRAWLLTCSLGLVVSPVAYAASATANYQVTASVMKACTVSTPQTLGFGSYDPNSSTALTNTTSFAVTCTAGTTYSVGMNAGTGGGASVTSRLMTSASAAAGSNTLNYGLYKDSSYSSNWDNSVSATGYTGTGGSQAITVYGRIPVNQYTAAPATDYSDTITMTLSY